MSTYCKCSIICNPPSTSTSWMIRFHNNTFCPAKYHQMIYTKNNLILSCSQQHEDHCPLSQTGGEPINKSVNSAVWTLTQAKSQLTCQDSVAFELALLSPFPATQPTLSLHHPPTSQDKSTFAIFYAQCYDTIECKEIWIKRNPFLFVQGQNFPDQHI